jgi:hypothetical protein
MAIHRLRQSKNFRHHARFQATRPRRLVVEHIEDRLLLSGTYQGGMDLSLSVYGNNSSTIILTSIANSTNSVTDTISLLSHGSSGNTIPLDWDADGRIRCRNANQDTSPDVRRLTILDLPHPPSPEKLIDFSLLPKTELVPMGAGDCMLAKNGKVSPPATSNITPRMEVDGARGRFQAFEISMSDGKETKHHAASALQEGKAIASHESSQWSNWQEASSVKHDSSDSRGDALLAKLQPSARFVSSSCESGDGHVSLKTAPVSNSFALSSLNSPSTTIENAIDADTMLVSDHGLPLEQVAISAPNARQAVFAEMAENSADHAKSPNSYGDHRSNNWFNVAIVAIVGQQLAQKWRRQHSRTETKQIPPRRRIA